MSRNPLPLFLRIVCVLVSIGLGWALQFGLYLMVAGPSPADLAFWMQWTGIYAAVAALLFGVPFAFVDPRAYTTGRQMRTIALGGGAGALLALVPPASAIFVLTVPLGFAAGAFAMWPARASLLFCPSGLAGRRIRRRRRLPTAGCRTY